MTTKAMTAKGNGGINLGKRLQRWAIRAKLARKAAWLIVIAAMISGFVTWTTLTSNLPADGLPADILKDNDRARTIYWLLNINGGILLLLATVLARKITLLWIARRRGRAGARLHGRLVAIFSLLAVVPAILMAAFSAAFFYVGVQGWFDTTVSTAVRESQAVAEAYLQEHQQSIRADALTMANDIDRDLIRLQANPPLFNRMIRTQTLLRNMTEGVVFDGTRRPLVRVGLSFGMEMEIEDLPESKLEQARNGDVILMVSDGEDRVRALVSVDRISDLFLMVGRPVEPRVLGHMQMARGAAQAYQDLEKRRASLQLSVTFIFVLVALLLLSAAVWLGLTVAEKLAAPIGQLILATERVRGGDLSVRILDTSSDDELGSLGRAFNRMTGQLETQRTELMEASRQIDQRRRFTEAVLSGLSAGIFGLDANGHITLANRSAGLMLATSEDSLIGQDIATIAPDMAILTEQARQKPGKVAESQIELELADGRRRTLLVRALYDAQDGRTPGYVVTFDDITELLTAQRKAAWADVARRIAHEIKNPLTPIQLAAERLKRRYLSQIVDDPEIFITCTDTIIRQVGDIGRMVDEFSDFARMPAPVMRPESLNNLARNALFLQKETYPALEWHFDSDMNTPYACDAQQIGQALTNLLKNAAESVTARQSRGENPDSGSISMNIHSVDEDHLAIDITDDGIGLPAAERDRLTEPYVTTRAKGTGLGLAIVRKIAEDHGGSLILQDRNDEKNGACVRLLLPKQHKSGSLATE